MNIIDIILNKEKKYTGNLEHYFNVLCLNPNTKAPYHNIEHFLHVMSEVYNACIWYEDEGSPIEPVIFRNLLIAALFHDYKHPGKIGNDTINIKTAICGLLENILKEDEKYFWEISNYIRATEFPHSYIYTFHQCIIQDADMSYTLRDSWIGSVLQLAEELGVSPENMLKGQVSFMQDHMKFTTEWGREKYMDKIFERIEEVKRLLKILKID